MLSKIESATVRFKNIADAGKSVIWTVRIEFARSAQEAAHVLRIIVFLRSTKDFASVLRLYGMEESSGTK
jgi:hypothetical protein